MRRLNKVMVPRIDAHFSKEDWGLKDNDTADYAAYAFNNTLSALVNAGLPVMIVYHNMTNLMHKWDKCGVGALEFGPRKLLHDILVDVYGGQVEKVYSPSLLAG